MISTDQLRALILGVEIVRFNGYANIEVSNMLELRNSLT